MGQQKQYPVRLSEKEYDQLNVSLKFTYAQELLLKKTFFSSIVKFVQILDEGRIL
ncbi:hypothetical protein IW492_04585 [Enterococcus sp. BWB1-3]|uniref:hypothetical protein n=1 Tax=unclassified Enterococcus TaxID=2608891 RepID=UPI0019241552|nr:MULTISPECIES: hypothetical protein [unclassified Enterococcus]MBL1228508.1 hypothetical protein [Enterococcus sp. BWB1-3]MCB5950513.1 hypothetical protein [Enterococcus sp. BWT-B8]MCB5954404.1 hypothetical protein [Enterococcus sp. CWB-B31]